MSGGYSGGDGLRRERTAAPEICPAGPQQHGPAFHQQNAVEVPEFPNNIESARPPHARKAGSVAFPGGAGRPQSQSSAGAVNALPAPVPNGRKIAPGPALSFHLPRSLALEALAVGAGALGGWAAFGTVSAAAAGAAYGVVVATCIHDSFQPSSKFCERSTPGPLAANQRPGAQDVEVCRANGEPPVKQSLIESYQVRRRVHAKQHGGDEWANRTSKRWTDRARWLMRD